MNKRNFITILSFVVCLASVGAVLVQRQQLAGLRVQQQGMLSQETQANAETPPSSETTAATSEPGTAAAPDHSSELLRLRSQVTRLSARQRELAGVVQESERLRAQLAGSSTNAPENRLPPGFIRKSEARNAGCNSPDDTLQTFLWALQNHDLTNVFETLTAGAAQGLQNQIQRQGNSAESFFKGTDVVPGLAIRSRQTEPDGSVTFEVEFLLGAPAEKFRFEPVNGQWKLAAPF